MEINETRLPVQTPLFHSLHRDRYSRQQAIREIEAITGRQMIVYAASLSHPDGAISEDDIIPFTDMLYRVPKDSIIDLMIIGLAVKYLPMNDSLWERLWRLYCLYEVAIRENCHRKIFESSYVSIFL